MTETITDRLAITGRSGIALIYLAGAALAGVSITAGAGRMIYGGYGFLNAPTLPGSALPLPADHRAALLAGDESAMKREALARLEGHRTATDTLPSAEEFRLEAQLTGMTGRAVEERSAIRRARDKAITEPLTHGAALIAFGGVIYLAVWLMRWLLTGRSTTVFSRRRRPSA